MLKKSIGDYHLIKKLGAFQWDLASAMRCIQGSHKYDAHAPEFDPWAF
jgi:hypothetical protein